ncbi:MAG TPA: M28 family peptidase [Candidatus Hydrogenedentes bacterium]|nr:M28 family peptidase [Candidatus Hydrogenedentota bacterium]
MTANAAGLGSMGKHAEGNALKIIAVAGALIVLALLGLSYVLREGLKKNENERVATRSRQSPYDGERAFAVLKTVVGFGPRPSGSAALEQLRDYIRRELKESGLEVREHAFDANTPLGVKRMVNLVGVSQGTTPGVIVLGGHYETKFFPDFTFVGANDAGSSTAWLIEMARVLSGSREGRSVWIVFFDGEEAMVKWSDADSLYGSRAFVEDIRQRGELSDIRAMINVDMIGDCYLGLYRDPTAPRWLEDCLWNTAQDLGYAEHFLERTLQVDDDHMPFRKAGIPAVDLIDFVYGGSILDHQRNWHTVQDTLDKVCAASLQAVGDVVYRALPKIDALLDKHPGG